MVEMEHQLPLEQDHLFFMEVVVLALHTLDTMDTGAQDLVEVVL